MPVSAAGLAGVLEVRLGDTGAPIIRSRWPDGAGRIWRAPHRIEVELEETDVADGEGYAVSARSTAAEPLRRAGRTFCTTSAPQEKAKRGEERSPAVTRNTL